MVLVFDNRTVGNRHSPQRPLSGRHVTSGVGIFVSLNGEFHVSRVTQLAEKVTDIVALHLHPPEKALVL